MAIANNQSNPYLKTQVETASKEQLVIMLFDGIIRFSEQARKAIVKNEIEDAHHNLMRAQAIIMELIYTVDREKGGEIAQNLLSLHAYAFNCLIVANMRKDVSKIDEVQKIYRELREGWVGAMQSLGLALSNAAPAAKPQAEKPAAAPQAAAPAEAPKGAAYGPGKIAPLPVINALPPAAPKAQGYGPGKTAVPQAAQPPKSESQSVMVSGQQQRSSQMLSAYGNGGRGIA